jgi:hypothetical protein
VGRNFSETAGRDGCLSLVRALCLVALAACTQHYDPIEDVVGSHRVFPDTRTAIETILAEADHPQVFAVGEYHDADATTLQHFNEDVVPLLAPHAKHLVIEAWLDAECGDPVRAQVEAATGRDAWAQDEIHQLVIASKLNKLVIHGLPITCIEQRAVLDPRGRVDWLLLLELITNKLGDMTREVMDDGGVIVYGGALHNDLYPPWPLDELSYTLPIAKDHGHVLEIDLVTPEVVAPMRMVRYEPWFPLLALASPSHVIAWQRAPDSYVVILPAQSDAPAAVAKPIY